MEQRKGDPVVNVKGMTVRVFRDVTFGDCSNRGISSWTNKVTLIGPGVPEMYEPDENAPGVVLVERTIGDKPYIHAEPIDRPDEGCVGWMAGGTFLYTTDSRFPSRYPISLHDRQETRQ